MALSIGTQICAQEVSYAPEFPAERDIMVKNSIKSIGPLQSEQNRKQPHCFPTLCNFLDTSSSLSAVPRDILPEIENHGFQNPFSSCTSKSLDSSSISRSMDLCFLKEFGMTSNTSTCEQHNWQNNPCRSIGHTFFFPNTDNSRSMNAELGNPVSTFSTSSSSIKSTICEENQLEMLLESPANSLLGQPSRLFLFQMGDELSAALISGLRGGLANFDSAQQNEIKQNCSLNQVHLIDGHGCTEAVVQEFNSTSNLHDITLDSDSGLSFFSESKEDLLEAIVAGFPSSRKLEPSSCSVTIDKISSRIGSSKGANFIDDNNEGGNPLEDPTQVSSSIEMQKSTNTNTTNESTSFIQNLLTDNSGTHSEGEGANGHEREDTTNTVRRRSKPGKTGRPRPKDRQQIQDRVRELREIVPNAHKCSIDALLERTIKYIELLHTITRHVGRWSYKGKFKISGNEPMTVLSKESESGASWAVDLGANGEIQGRQCPIIVENLSQPGQMLVEILCEDKGIFLEIANSIRGLGLTILKGAMEVRNGHIWGRFVVEAIRDIHRVEVLWSLAHII